MLGKPRILPFSPTRLINSIKHEHSCKILYLTHKRTAGSWQLSAEFVFGERLKIHFHHNNVKITVDSEIFARFYFRE